MTPGTVPPTLFRLTLDVLPVPFILFFLPETLSLLLRFELVDAVEYQLLQLGKCVLGMGSASLLVPNPPHLLREGILAFLFLLNKKLGILQVRSAQHPSCVTPYSLELHRLIKHMVDEVDNHHHKPTIQLAAATIINA